MREYKKCTTCNTYHFTDLNCPDIFHITHHDKNGDEETEIRASNFADAAETYAETYDYENDLIKEGESWDISVRKEGVIKKYTITATVRIDYNAKEIS